MRADRLRLKGILLGLMLQFGTGQSANAQGGGDNWAGGYLYAEAIYPACLPPVSR